MKRILFVLLFVFTISIVNAQGKETEESKIIQLDNISSFNDLSERFQGKIIYLDIIASWCKPCIAELKESKKLDAFFEENDIVKVYISIDDPENVGQCLDILNTNNIEGYYITRWIAGKDFNKELMDYFLTDEKGNISISIPRYAIINKKGVFVEYKAERPSNAEALKVQLAKYL